MRARLAGAEVAIVRPRGEADDPDRRAARGQRHADDGTEHAGRASPASGRERVVVVDGDRPVRQTWPTETLSTEHAVPEKFAEHAAPVADDERPLVGFDEVDVAVRRPDQRRGPGQDRLEQDLRSRARRAAPAPSHRARAGTGRPVTCVRPRGRWLGEVERPVGHVHQRVLGPPSSG